MIVVYHIKSIYNHQYHFKILRLKMGCNCVKKVGEIKSNMEMNALGYTLMTKGQKEHMQ